MKVLQINAVYGFGSTGRFVMEMHTYMLKCGYDSFVAYGERRHEDNERVFFVGNNLDHNFHALMSRISGKQGYFSKIATGKLCRRIESIKPDIVHLHNLHANFINLPRLFKCLIKNQIPVVITLHDCWFFTGKCCHYVGVGCEKFRTECHSCPLIKANNPSLFFDRSKKMFKDKKRWFSSLKLGVVGVSEWITGEAKKSFLKTADDVRCIYNWIDSDKFVYTYDDSVNDRYGFSKEDRMILAVSQGWDDRKGLSDLIALARALDGCKVVIVGRLDKRTELPRNMISVPFLSDVSELVKLYSRADVFANPSKMETFGKVTAEAMCCGTPAVVYNNTANAEIVTDGVGERADNNDTEDFIEKVKMVLGKGKATYFDNCVTSAHTRFSMGTNIQKYIELYKKLMRQSGAR